MRPITGGPEAEKKKAEKAEEKKNLASVFAIIMSSIRFCLFWMCNLA